MFANKRASKELLFIFHYSEVCWAINYYLVFSCFFYKCTLVTYVIAVVSIYMGFLEAPPILIRSLYFSY